MYLIKFLLFSFIICLTTSCNEGDHNNEKTKYDKIKTTEKDKKDKVKGPFLVQSGSIEYQVKNLKDEITSINKLYFDNFGSLIKLEETTKDETSIYIYNNATKKGVTLFAGRDKATKIHVKQGEINRFVSKRSESGFTKQNDEKVVAKDCAVYANNAKTDKGESKVIYWLYNGIVLKEINRLGAGYIFEATKFEEKAIERNLFSLPKGIEMPHNIFE